MRDLKGKTLILRLELQNPAENLELSICVKMLLLLQDPDLGQQTPSILVQTIIHFSSKNVACEGPTATAWETLLESEYLKWESKFCPSL